MTEHSYTARQAAYDLRKIRGNRLIVKPGRSRRYHLPDDASRIIAANNRTIAVASVVTAALSGR